MEEFLTMEKIDSITELIRSKLKETPDIALILGSGLGDLVNLVENPVSIPFRPIL